MKRVKRHKVKKEKLEPSSSFTREQEEHDLAYYIHDRVELMHQVFSALKYKDLKAMAPECVRHISLADLQELCTEELLGISSKRLCAILDGAEPPSDTESSSKSPSPPLETISLDSISSDEEILSETSRNSKKNKKHRHRHRSSKDKNSKNRSKSKEGQPEEEDRSKASRAGLTVLELLELQARARAIRAQLQNEQGAKLASESAPPESTHSSDNEVEIKEEPSEVVEISSEDEKPKIEDLEKETQKSHEVNKTSQGEPQTVTKRISDLVITIPQSKQTRKIKLNRSKMATNTEKSSNTKAIDSVTGATGKNKEITNAGNASDKNKIKNKDTDKNTKAKNVVSSTNKKDNTTVNIEKITPNKANIANVKEKPAKKSKVKKKKKETSMNIEEDHDEITLQLSDSEKMDLLEDLDRKNFDNVSSSCTEDSESSSETSDDEDSSFERDRIKEVDSNSKRGTNSKVTSDTKEIESESTLQPHASSDRVKEVDSIIKRGTNSKVTSDTKEMDSESTRTHASNVRSTEDNTETSKLTSETSETKTEGIVGLKPSDKSGTQIDSSTNDTSNKEKDVEKNIIDTSNRVESTVESIQNKNLINATEMTKNDSRTVLRQEQSMIVSVSGNSDVDKHNEHENMSINEVKHISTSNKNVEDNERDRHKDIIVIDNTKNKSLDVPPENDSSTNPATENSKQNDNTQVIVEEVAIIFDSVQKDNIDLNKETTIGAMDAEIIKGNINIDDSNTKDDNRCVKNKEPAKYVNTTEPMDVTTVNIVDPNKSDNVIRESPAKTDTEKQLSEGELSDNESSGVEVTDLKPEVVCISDEEVGKKKKKKKDKKKKKSKKKSDFREGSDQNFFKDNDDTETTNLKSQDNVLKTIDKYSDGNKKVIKIIDIDNDDNNTDNIIIDKSKKLDVEVEIIDKDPIDNDSTSSTDNRDSMENNYIIIEDEILILSDDSSCYEVDTYLSKEPTAEEIEALSLRIDEIDRQEIITEKEIREHERELMEKEKSSLDIHEKDNTDKSVEVGEQLNVEDALSLKISEKVLEEDLMSWKDRYLGSKKVKKVLSTANIFNALRKKNIELKKKLDLKRIEEELKKRLEKEKERAKAQQNLEVGSVEHYNTLQGSTKYVDPVKDVILQEENIQMNGNTTQETAKEGVTREMKRDAKQLLKMYKKLLKYNDMSKIKDPNKKKKKKRKV